MKEEISEFLNRVRRELNPEKIILFGSRAKEGYLKDSDYDIIVVSKKFEGISFFERLYLLYELWDHDFRADILAYTPEEFEVKKRRSESLSRQ